MTKGWYESLQVCEETNQTQQRDSIRTDRPIIRVIREHELYLGKSPNYYPCLQWMKVSPI